MVHCNAGIRGFESQCKSGGTSVACFTWGLANSQAWEWLSCRSGVRDVSVGCCAKETGEAGPALSEVATLRTEALAAALGATLAAALGAALAAALGATLAAALGAALAAALGAALAAPLGAALGALGEALGTPGARYLRLHGEHTHTHTNAHATSGDHIANIGIHLWKKGVVLGRIRQC